jgi:hypothetical protein
MIKLTKEKQQHLIIVGIVAVVVIVGIYFTIVTSQTDSMTKLAADIAKKQDDVNKAENVIKFANPFLKELAETTNKLNSVEADMAPANDKYAWFVDIMRKFLLNYQNQISMPSKSREIVGDVTLFPAFPYRSATFSVRGEAQFHQFGRFLAELENNYKYFRVQRLSLIPAQGESGEAEKLAFDMDIVTLVNPNLQ